MDDMKISGFLGTVVAKIIKGMLQKNGYDIKELRFNSINVHNVNGMTSISVSAEAVVPDKTVTQLLKDTVMK